MLLPAVHVDTGAPFRFWVPCSSVAVLGQLGEIQRIGKRTIDEIQRPNPSVPKAAELKKSWRKSKSEPQRHDKRLVAPFLFPFSFFDCPQKMRLQEMKTSKICKTLVLMDPHPCRVIYSPCLNPCLCFSLSFSPSFKNIEEATPQDNGMQIARFATCSGPDFCP